MKRQWIWSALTGAAALGLASCASTTVPEDESTNVYTYEKQIEAVSGGFAAEQTLIASLLPKLKSSADACEAYSSSSAALLSQCMRVRAVAYYLMGRSRDAETVQAVARDDMQALAPALSSLCVPPVTDPKTAENCQVTTSYVGLMDTRLMTTGLQALALDENAAPERLVAAFTDLGDGIERDWPGSGSSLETVQQEKMACALYSADDQLAVRLSGSDDWPAIRNASTAALVQASAALQLPICNAGSSGCDATVCVREPESVSCQRERLAAVGLLCAPGATG